MIKHLTLPKKMAAMVLLAGAALSIAPVQAASYPTKQIELVVPYAAGGGTEAAGSTFCTACGLADSATAMASRCRSQSL